MKKAIVAEKLDKQTKRDAINAYGALVIKYTESVSVGDDLGVWHDKKERPQVIECPNGDWYLVKPQEGA